MDFFGLATMSASGWIDSKGHFGLRLHGELVLGSRSFGLVGEFKFSVLLKEETSSANGTTQYHFRVFFSADVDARLFGISFAGVGLSAEVEARGTGGEVDLVASVTVRIKILFIKISKTVRFKIGTIQLPKPVYLAGEGPSATVGTALWRGATTPQALYLNMGERAKPDAATSRAAASATAADGDLHRRARRRHGRQRDAAHQGHGPREDLPASPRSTPTPATAPTRSSSAGRARRRPPRGRRGRDMILFAGSATR